MSNGPRTRLNACITIISISPFANREYYETSDFFLDRGAIRSLGAIDFGFGWFLRSAEELQMAMGDPLCVVRRRGIDGARHHCSVEKKLNEQQFARGEEKIYLGAHALFELTSIFAIPGARPIGLIVLTFNGEGRVLNQKGVPSNMSAQRIRLDRLVLMRNSTQGPSYHFAYWAQGIPGDVTFSPAVCSSEDNRRYVAGWDVENYIGNFGCREWTAQLYDRDQPYIDVTSYASRGAYIGALTGWSRFEDPPKPVIGRQGTTWLCLHECPAGEKPGVITDIRAWTTKHGFPMPTRPSKQPLYPNADYMDDLNEFWQQ